MGFEVWGLGFIGFRALKGGSGVEGLGLGVYILGDWNWPEKESSFLKTTSRRGKGLGCRVQGVGVGGMHSRMMVWVVWLRVGGPGSEVQGAGVGIRTEGERKCVRRGRERAIRNDRNF